MPGTALCGRRASSSMPNTKKLPARPPHQSHHCPVDSLCATCPHFRSRITVPCTTTGNPQSVHTNHTTAPLSSTTPPTSRAGPTSGCPQHAQDLILLLVSLRSFFFEKTSGDSPSSPPRYCRTEDPRVTRSISFQDGVRSSTVVVRLPFRLSQRVAETGIRQPGQYPISRGIVWRMEPGCSRL